MKHKDHEGGAATEGNAAESLKAVAGVAPAFTPLNVEPGHAWATEGNAGEAIGAIGGVADYHKSSSIQSHGPVELSPTRADAGSTVAKRDKKRDKT